MHGGRFTSSPRPALSAISGFAGCWPDVLGAVHLAHGCHGNLSAMSTSHSLLHGPGYHLWTGFGSTGPPTADTGRVSSLGHRIYPQIAIERSCDPYRRSSKPVLNLIVSLFIGIRDYTPPQKDNRSKNMNEKQSKISLKEGSTPVNVDTETQYLRSRIIHSCQSSNIKTLPIQFVDSWKQSK